jgi:hypothetical protein
VGDILYLRTQGIRNGAGTDLRFRNTNVDATSQIFSAIQRITDDISITYGLMNRGYHQMNFQTRHEGYYDVVEINPGEEFYRTGFDYSKRMREDWFGFGIGWKLLPDLGFGISVFGSLMSDDYNSYISSNVFTNDPASNNLVRIAYNNQYDVLRYRNISGLLVTGLAYDNGSFQMGLNITTTTLTIPLFSKGMLDRAISSDIPGILDDPVYAAFTVDQSPTKRKTPFIFDFGIARILGTRTSTNLKLSYFSRVKPYQLIEADPPANDIDNFYPTDPRFYQMSSAHKHTLNFALGIERRVSEDIAVLVGFNTDFNYMPHEEITDVITYHKSLSYLDLYQVNGGINWFRDKFNLILGLSFQYGYNYGRAQQINLKDPKDNLGLFGPIQYNTENHYLRINLVFGFTYLFPRI